MKRSTPIAQWSSRNPGRWLLGILMSLAFTPVLAHATHAPSSASATFPGKISLQEGKLTARIVSAPLWQVMEEVGKLSGAQVLWLSQDGEEPVSVEFADLPFSDALRRILGEKNFMLFYSSPGEGARLTQIWITSRGTAGGQPVLTPQPVSQEETTPIAEGPAVNIEQPLDVVIQTAMSDEDLSSRLSAIEYLGRYAQEDARAKAILSQLAHNDSNPQVQDIASAMLAGME